ncbi:unnamed protein product [Auanema sp. JU1783]|nr:unnamed protein product [Auanema sp. JU1783]
MLGTSRLREAFGLCSAIRACQAPTCSTRNTWVLRRVYAPEVTPPGGIQRNPRELPDLQKLEVVDFETKKAAGPLKVILLEDIEGIGHQFDIVSVDRKTARTDLLLSRKAVYASPFDIEYYAKMKEKMADELAARVRIPFEFLSVGRELQKLVVPIKVSMDNKWTIDRQILKTSLRQVGVDILDDSIYLADEPVSGPNFELEAMLVRFYVTVSKQYIVPMLGRLTHISVDESKQILSPSGSKLPSAKDLSKYGLVPEKPFYSKTAEFESDYPVFDFMQKKRIKSN